MSKKPVSYEEWLLSAGEKNKRGRKNKSLKKGELGLKVLISYTTLQDVHREQFINSNSVIIRDAFQQALFENGYVPHSIEFSTENDPETRAKEVTAIIEISQGMSLKEFAPVVYAQAVDFYNQVQVWESKSLWQYIKWWLKRKWQ